MIRNMAMENSLGSQVTSTRVIISMMNVMAMERCTSQMAPSTKESGQGAYRTEEVPSSILMDQ
jgi:hypothetical protein